MYEFKINDAVDLFANLSSKHYDQLRQIKREKAKVVMIFAMIISKSRYNNMHKTLSNILKSSSKIYLRLHQGYIISRLVNRKLSKQRVEFFKIIKIVDKFKQIWRLEFSSIMKIYFVISITQLKSAIFGENLYDRIIDKDLSSVENEKINTKLDKKASSYELERLLDKKITRGKSSYLVKWKNYDNQHNV